MEQATQGRLRTWLRAQGLIGHAELRVNPLTGGQSNPTFLLTAGAEEFVLRKKPEGLLMKSAHAIDREYRVISALKDTPVPVPDALAWCDDERIIGTPFYLMSYLNGRVFVDQSLPDMASAERAAIYGEMNRVISELHRLNIDAIGLGDYGKREEYLSRQISRWSSQLSAATLPVPDSALRLMAWLPANLPPPQPAALIHGDFRLDNLIFHQSEPKVIGVLDWELSTIGDPIADFAYHCMSWHIPHTLWRGIAGLDLQLLGIPEEAAYQQQYFTGRNAIDPADWRFYLAFNLFRMSAILFGIAERAQQGNANAADAVQTGAKAEPLADLGCAIVGI